MNAVVVPSYSLAPMAGPLDRNALLHLLRRCLFGVGHKELRFFEGKSLDRCLDTLLTPAAVTVPLQEDSDVADPLVPKGKRWTGAPFENDLIDNRRGLFLKMWWSGRMLNRDFSLTEKMALFWHNHYVVQIDMVQDSRYAYRYADMLHTHALGNYKKLISEGTVNVAMLVYLNGNQNIKSAPNENFSRELFELFTLGKGSGIKYTEDDIKAAARVLSGWKDDKDDICAVFHPELHDTGDKHFSDFFGNAVIRGKAGAEGAHERQELVEMIFRKEETARFFCRNLYRWFVFGHIDEAVEEKIIAPLAQIFMDAGFEVVPVLRTLLGSEHFFDRAFRGCIVKSPVDFLVGAMQQFDAISLAGIGKNHESWLQFYFSLSDMSMDIGNPPSVSGWPAYYQPPKYHRWWVNSASLSLRKKVFHEIISPKGMVFNGINLSFNFLPFVEQLDDPANVNTLVEDSLRILLAVEVDAKEKARLKNILLSGQASERYWEESWNGYLKNENHPDAKSVVEYRLRTFFKTIMDLPEYQMS